MVAVIVEPLRPNETLFEFEKTIALRLFDVVPALTLILVSDVAIVTDAVTVLPLIPNDTLLLLEKTTSPFVARVVPALTDMTPSIDAVIRELPDIPNEMLLEFENTIVPVDTLCVPALIPNGAPPPPEITTLPLLIPTETPPAPAKIIELVERIPVLDWVVFEVANAVMFADAPAAERTNTNAQSALA
jgi:hypothetical protein